MTKTRLLDAALELAEQGWAIFPIHEKKPDALCSCGNPECKSAGKHPRIKAWQENATSEHDHVRRWWARWPTANIGLAAGLSGVLVVDLDVKHGVDGLASWAALCDRHGLNGGDVDTATVTTPSGGQHLYFALPEDTDLSNTAGKLAEGIDTRAGSGYVVAPPSEVNGTPYTWGDGADMLPLPGAILDLLKPKAPKPTPARSSTPTPSRRDLSPYVQRALDDERRIVQEARPGTRDNTLFQAAENLGDLVGSTWANLDRQTVINALLGAFEQSTLASELSEAAALDKIERGIDRAIGTPRPEPADNRALVATSTIPSEPEPTADIDQDQDTAFLLSYGPDDAGNAMCVLKLYPGQFLYTNEVGWLWYNGHFWEHGLADSRLGRATIRTLQKRQHAAVDAKRKDILTAANPSAHHKSAAINILGDVLAVKVDDFDRDPDLLNCQNGVLDLRTGELSPHTAKQRFTYCLPVDYDPQAKSKEWSDFIAGAVDGDDLAGYIQEAAGYTLTGHTREEILFYVHGPTRSGKGTFTEVLLAVLGNEPLSTEADFSTFTKRRDQDAQNFDLAGLKPCRFVAASESSQYDRLNTAKIKAVTGGNYVRCAHKHKPFFTYRPQYKIWLVSNHSARVDVDDDAAWYRVRVIPFPHSHAGREDKLLKARLQEPHNLRAVLAWAVEGTRRWYASKGGLTTPETVTEATQQAREVMDFVGQWLTECIKAKGDGFLSNTVLYTSYKTWCEENGVTPKHLGSLTRALKSKGYAAGAQHWDTALNRQTRGCAGVSIG